MRPYLLLLCVLVAPALAYAYNPTIPTQIQPNATLSAFISANVPQGVMAGASYYLESLSGAPYILIVNGTGGHILITQAANGSYSFVLNKSAAFSIIKSYESSTNFPSQQVLNQLHSYMFNFENVSAKNLTTCLQFTGVTRYNGTYFLCNASTTLSSQQTCMANTCDTVAICGGALRAPQESVLQAEGIPSPFASGVQNLSIQYNQLRLYYNEYFDTLASINYTNVGSSIRSLQSLAVNISKLNATLRRNPVFPPPPNFTTGFLLSACTMSTAAAPWYCQQAATPFCPMPNFSYSDIGQVESTLSGLASLPLTDAQIAPIANATVSEDEALFRPILFGAELRTLTNAKAAIAPRYYAELDNATALLSMVHDPALAANVSDLTAAFYDFSQFNSNMNASRLSSQQASLLEEVNVSQVSSSVTRQLGLLGSSYTAIKSRFNGLYAEAENNTVTLLLDQLTFGSAMPKQLAPLLASQELFNAQLASGINSSQINTLSSNMVAIKSQAQSLSQPYSLPLLLKNIDGGILSVLETGPGSIEAKEAAAPLWVFAISLAVGVVVLLVIYMLTYVRLKSSKRIKLNPRVRRAWAVLFTFLFMIALLYAAWTYMLAQAATGFLPVSSFMSSVAQSKSVYIGVNTSIAGFASNSTAVQCADALKAELNKSGRPVYIIRAQNYSCSLSTGPGYPVTGTACLDYAASRGPLILINPDSSGSLSYSGLYYNVLQAGGAAVSGQSCLLAKVMSNS